MRNIEWRMRNKENFGQKRTPHMSGGFCECRLTALVRSLPDGVCGVVYNNCGWNPTSPLRIYRERGEVGTTRAEPKSKVGGCVLCPRAQAFVRCESLPWVFDSHHLLWVGDESPISHCERLRRNAGDFRPLICIFLEIDILSEFLWLSPPVSNVSGLTRQTICEVLTVAVSMQPTWKSTMADRYAPCFGPNGTSCVYPLDAG